MLLVGYRIFQAVLYANVLACALEVCHLRCKSSFELAFSLFLGPSDALAANLCSEIVQGPVWNDPGWKGFGRFSGPGRRTLKEGCKDVLLIQYTCYLILDTSHLILDTWYLYLIPVLKHLYLLQQSPSTAVWPTRGPADIYLQLHSYTSIQVPR